MRMRYKVELMNGKELIGDWATDTYNEEDVKNTVSLIKERFDNGIEYISLNVGGNTVIVLPHAISHIVIDVEK